MKDLTMVNYQQQLVELLCKLIPHSLELPDNDQISKVVRSEVFSFANKMPASPEQYGEIARFYGGDDTAMRSKQPLLEMAFVGLLCRTQERLVKKGLLPRNER